MARASATPWLRALALAAAAAGPGLAQDAGPDVLSETYRNWVVVCRTAPPAEGAPPVRTCEMTQELRQTEGGQRVLALALRPATAAGSAPGAAELTLVTPFGLKVTEPVELRLGETRLASVPFHTCLAIGCIARATLGPDTITTLSTTETPTTTATIALPTTGGTHLQIPIPLDGFALAWTRLQGL